MAADYTLSPDLQSRIKDGIESCCLVGRDGHGQQKSFVPYDNLLDYWEESRIREVLSYLPVPPPVNTIRQKYLRIFSTLAFNNKIAYLESFTSHGLGDESWPRIEFPPYWPHGFRPFFDDFKRAQWTFFPLEFDRNELIGRHLPQERILPIETERGIKLATPGNHGVRISKFTIHEPCNKFAQDDTDNSERTTNTFLLKTYNLFQAEHEAAYRCERDAYTLMGYSDGASDHVVQYYGSFKQSGSGHLILEYVGGGTLLEYLRRNHNPQTVTDIHDFWTSISGLPLGLLKVHQVVEGSSRPFQRAITHQDLKLDNILLDFSDELSRYIFRVKLVDFGNSGIATNRHGEGELRAHDLRGNATHSAPEGTHHHPVLEEGQDTLPLSSDIWALGCILLQVAAWVAEGMDNLDTFRMMRSDELWMNPRFRGSGFTQSFHDGATVLKAVFDKYHLILAQLRDNGSVDKITPRILDLVIKHMLVVDRERFTAKNVWCHMDKILNELRPEPGQDDAKCDIRSPIRHLERGGSQRQTKSLTIDQCVQYRHDRKAETPPDRHVHSLVQKLVRNLGGRDHLFLIDDSPSMRLHHDDIVRVFTGLSYVARLLDPNGIELAFASAPSITERNTSTTALINVVQKHRYEQEPGLMEDKLEDFLQHAVIGKLHNNVTRRISSIYRKNPLTVFILTDGKWGTSRHQAAGVQNPILSLMEKMKDRRIARTKVMLQFLRFGDDPDGKMYLRHLDEMGQQYGR